MERARHIVYLAVLLSLALSAQGGVLAHVLFQMRQSYVAEHLCENRFHKGMHCHGKCFLKKRLADAEKDRTERTQTSTPSPVAVYVIVAEQAPAPEQPAVQRPWGVYDERHAQEDHPFLFDPPPKLA